MKLSQSLCKECGNLTDAMVFHTPEGPRCSKCIIRECNDLEAKRKKTADMFDVCVRLMNDAETDEDREFFRNYFRTYYPELEEFLND